METIKERSGKGGKTQKMEDSGAILCQISSFKDMLDHVNQEIEANIQLTRQIESEIIKCEEAESTLASNESELTRILYVLQFEIISLISVASCSVKSAKALEEELSLLRKKREDFIRRINEKREQFTTLCQEFQKELYKGGNNVVENLLSKKEALENEIHLLDQKNNALENSMLAFVEEVLQDLNESNSALHVEIQNESHENDRLIKEIDDLKTMLVSGFS